VSPMAPVSAVRAVDRRLAVAGTCFAGAVIVHNGDHLRRGALPARSWLSDSFTSAASVSPLSWFAASLELGAALALGATGATGATASARPGASGTGRGRATMWGVASVFALSQVVVVVVSFAQR